MLCSAYGMPAPVVCLKPPPCAVRIILDQELQQSGRGAPRAYAGWADCAHKSWRSGGTRALWRGLTFGLAREFM